MDGDRRAIAALVTVQLLFGAWPVAGKRLFVHLDPVEVMAARVVGAALVLAVLHAMVRQPVPLRGNLRALAVLSLLGVVANQTLFLSGLQRTTALHASLAITTIPVFTYAIAVLMGRESWGPRRAMGVGLAMAGAVYLVGITTWHGGWHQAAGDVMILANCISFAVYLVLSKPLNERYDPLSVTTWTFALGALLFLPVMLWLDVPATVMALDGPAWGWLAFAILGPSVLTYVLNAVALRHVPASTVAVFIYLQPVVTALLAWWVLGDRVPPRILPAAALVFAGLWLVARRRPRVLEGQAVTD